MNIKHLPAKSNNCVWSNKGSFSAITFKGLLGKENDISISLTIKKLPRRKIEKKNNDMKKRKETERDTRGLSYERWEDLKYQENNDLSPEGGMT